MQNIFYKNYNTDGTDINFKLKPNVSPKKVFKTVSILNQEEDEDDR